MIESQELLEQYVQTGSEEAFRELVARYIDLVYSTALRLVAGDRHLAEDVTQTVFVHLCRNAGRISGDALLGGWLHRDACYTASKAIRTERRRQAREKQIAVMDSLPDHTQANLAALAPILDDAVNVLGEEDRAAILLRFFEQRDFRSVGAALGSNEDAARMRVSRALEKLRELLNRRGVTLSAAALGTALAGEAVTAAPAGLAVTVAGAALTGSAAVGSGAILVKVMTMTNIKAGLIGAAVLGVAAVPIYLQHKTQLAMREENRALHQQFEQLASENERLSNQVAVASSTADTGREQERELLRLRGEVGNLRRQVTEAAKVQEKNASKGTQATDPAITPESYTQMAGLAKLNYAKGWTMAFFLYSQQHQGEFPTKFEEAELFLPAEYKTEHNLGADEFPPGAPKYGLTPDRYEILFQGSPSAISNPPSVIVLREKEAWQSPDGGWLRAYGFADGHSEIHKAADGNFQPWESQHLAPTTPQAGQ